VADSGIKKVVVLKSELPPVSSNNSYRVRFRMISEDRNRTSHWSPLKELSSLASVPVSGNTEYTAETVTIVWGDEQGNPNYDIFVGFDGASPSYHGTSATHTYSLLNNGTTSVEVIIQIESAQKVLSSQLEIYSETILL
jgi:hypothetical protein